MTNRRASSQDSSRLQKTSITKTNLLIMNLSEGVHQGDIGEMSKQLDTKRLKLIMKLSQKVVGLMKLKCSYLISAGCSVTLSKKLLLMNSNKIGFLSSRLTLLMKKRPHLMSLLKLHNINSKTVLILAIRTKPARACSSSQVLYARN
jgi:hypothetical protein